MKPFIAFLLIGFNPNAQAATKWQTVTTELPKMESSRMEPVRIPAADESRVAISLSNWGPTDLRLPGNGSQLTNFERTSMPQLTLAWKSSPVEWGAWELRALKLRAETGVSLSALRRTGQALYAGVPQQASQVLYVIPFRLGVNAQPAWADWRHFRAHAGIYALPTLAFGERSVFSPGSSDAGLGVEGAIGISRRITPLLGLGLEVFSTTGSLGGGSLGGQGFRAELSFNPNSL